MDEFYISQNSFNAGIWTDELDDRNDLAKYGSSCSEILNGIVKAYGGICNRPGTEYIGNTGTKRPKMIPFQFNVEQSYILVLIEYKGYVIKDSGVVQNDAGGTYEFTHPYTEDDIPNIMFTQSADVLYLTHKNYRPAKLSRYDHNDWEYAETFFNIDVTLPDEPTVVQNSSATGDVYWYGVTLVDDSYHESEIVEIATQMKIGDTIDFGCLPTAYENGLKFNIYRQQSGIYGWVDACTASTWTDPNDGGTNPDMDATPPEDRDPCEEEGDYPTGTTIHEGRLVIGGSDNKPRTFFGSVSSDYANFSIRSPLQDSDSYEFEISGSQVNRIEWFMSTHKGLLIGTGGGIYLASGDPISPNDISVVMHSADGTAAVAPIKAGTAVLYVKRGKNIICSVQYSALSEVFEGENLSLLADNEFDTEEITRIIWQSDPDDILWCVRSDGILLGMTYDKNQKIAAWHKHDTQGEFIDAALIQNGTNRELVYFIVKRNGNYCIEVMKDRNLQGDINNSWFLDSAVEYSGDETETLSELDHLEGMTISVFSEGAVIEDLTVEDGSVTLPYPVTSAVAGLTYETRIASMDVLPIAEQKYALSSIKSVANMTVHVKETCRIAVSGTGDDVETNWQDICVSSDHDAAAPYTLKDGKFQKTISNNTTVAEGEVPGSKLYIKNTLPLPMMIKSMSCRVNVG